MADRGARPAALYRRSPHLVLHWQDGQLILHNYAVRRTLPAHALLVDILRQFNEWRPLDRFLDTVPPGARPGVARVLRELHRQRLLWRQGDTLTPSERAHEAWGPWNPAAGFFHAATRDVSYVDLDTLIVRLGVKARTSPMPPPLKAPPGDARVVLPAPRTRGAFADVLRARRTWRRFGRAPLALDDLATLLDLSAGVQRWATAEGEGPIALKTSPSGGARHPIEAYVAVRDVRTLRPGFYHYAAGERALVRLTSTRGVPAFDTLLPTQWWYRGASALVLLTAVFERTRWRYGSPRAYRAVLLEAGHVCQTFCLTATWLGLAPFCSRALDDERIERMLGIDGVSEAVLYAAGVGTRPPPAADRLPGSLPSRPPTRRRPQPARRPRRS